MSITTISSTRTIRALVAALVLLCLQVAAWSPTITSAARPSTRLQMAATEEEVYKGTVKWFDNVKGFGFITRESDGEDVFVHQTAIQAEGFRALEDGATVEFQVQEIDGKTRAAQVTGPEGEPIQRGYAYKKRDEEN